MTHTPEPWEILRHDLGDEEIFFVPVEILAGNGKLVVAYEGGLAPAAHEWTVEEIEANASLIAAAPDMLRALEAVCGDSEESDYLMQAQIQAMCRSAIRKARGEE
jgi:hypothetical protein